MQPSTHAIGAAGSPWRLPLDSGVLEGHSVTTGSWAATLSFSYGRVALVEAAAFESVPLERASHARRETGFMPAHVSESRADGNRITGPDPAFRTRPATAATR